ncbi:MAG: mannitol dehydrogenase family protein [Boseongicola sp.]
MSRILHFGPGNFFRAHLADYTNDAGGWALTGVSLRSASVRDGLSARKYRYTLAVQGEKPKQINIIQDILVAPENPSAVLSAIRDPAVKVISATVTEKGYHLRPDGALNLEDPDIKSDLQGAGPGTFIGFLARGLAGRTHPVTVLSCDNRMGNGDALAAAVRSFSAAAGLEISATVAFPNCMVDRITPATTELLRKSTGDPMAVACEPFKEWVIEDRFAAERPNWPGVQWVDDVAPHEKRKLRMLNGAHSYLAYAGVLAGYQFVHEAVQHPELRATAKALMKESAETLEPELQGQADSYADALIARFENSQIEHRLRQIAMDGSEKVPYRLIGSLRDRSEIGLSSPAISKAVRAWIAFCISETRANEPLDDPRTADLATAASGDDPTRALLAVIEAEDLARVIAE